MPGGLTRVAGGRDVPVVSMQRGGGSKDTWVLSDGPVSTMSLLSPPGVAVRHERRSADLSSRVADNLFWLGRYAERAEHTMRLLRTIVVRLTDEDTTEDATELVGAARRAGQLEAAAGGLRATDADSRSRPGSARGPVPTESAGRLAPDAERPASHRERRQGPAVAGYLADPEPVARGFPSPARSHPVRRCAGALEPDDHGSRGIQRHGDGEHDTGSRLAVSRRRPASGAFVQLDEPGAWRARGRARRRCWDRCSKSPTAR